MVIDQGVPRVMGGNGRAIFLRTRKPPPPPLNRAGSPGLEPAKGLATVDRHQGTQRRELKAADDSKVEGGRLRDSAETLRRGHVVRRPLKPCQGWRLGAEARRAQSKPVVSAGQWAVTRTVQ